MDPDSFGLGLVAGFLLTAAIGVTLLFIAALRIQGYVDEGIHDVIADTKEKTKD